MGNSVKGLTKETITYLQKQFCSSLTSYRSWCVYLCDQMEDNHIVAWVLKPYGHSSIVL